MEKLYTIKILGVIVLMFWIFSLVYQIIHPMPLPQSLQWLGIVLPAVAFVNSIIIAIPLRRLLITK